MFYPGGCRKVLVMLAPFLVCITQTLSGKLRRKYLKVIFKNISLFLIIKRTNKSSPEYDFFLVPASVTTIISQKGGNVLYCLVVLFFYGIKRKSIYFYIFFNSRFIGCFNIVIFYLVFLFI